MKFTKSYLQTLTTDELLHLADINDLFLSDDLTRRILIGELLDLEEDTADSGNIPEEPARIKQCSYNVTEIHIVLKDPIWFLVFWDFHHSLLTSLTRSKEFSTFFLRVSSLDPENMHRAIDFFDIQIPSTDRKRYVHVSFDEYFHRVDLMVRFLDGREQLLAQSNIAGMKRCNIPQRLCVSQNNADRITALSGLAALKKSHFQHYRQAFQ